MAESVRVLLKEEEVDKRIQELGEQISRDYQGKSVHLVCVLKGGVFFMCELAKRITVPVTMDFMSASSYGSSTKSSGVVKIVKDLVYVDARSDGLVLGADGEPPQRDAVLDHVCDSGRVTTRLEFVD